MKTLTLCYLTLYKIFHQPAFMFLLIVEFTLIFLLLFGVHGEYEGDLLISISVFGKNIEVDLILYSLLPLLISFLWRIVMFLIIVGAAPLFSEFHTDPLLPLYLIKGISRFKLLLLYYVWSVLIILFAQVVVACVFILVFYFKFGVIITKVAYAFAFGPPIIVAILIGLSAIIAVVFEKPMVSMLVLLLCYYLQLFIYEGYLFHTSTTISIFMYIFPPLAQVQKHFLSAALQSQVFPFPVYSLFYVLVYLLLAIVLFERKEIA